MSFEQVTESRWKRKRKNLSRLKLTYPSDSEIVRLIGLAKLREPSRFQHHVCSLILDAHLNELSFRNLTTQRAKSVLDKVAHKSEQLAIALKGIDVWSGGPEEYAGHLLEIELSKISPSSLLPDYITAVARLKSAAKAASPIKIRGKRNPAFNRLVEGLWLAAHQYGGHWTIYRSSDQRWVGTLLDALKILEPYLPRHFLRGRLGRPALYAVENLKEHITKSLPSPL